ncbi:MAG: hypothetical protein D6690_14880 [Nitrospirae bacterium]|nr:MAG: hypothetical protein D6690_14880 [Nitrospirota bacterium]
MEGQTMKNLRTRMFPMMLLTMLIVTPSSLLADQQEAEGEHRAALVSKATIPIEDAIQVAREQFDVTVIEAELEEEDGKTVWEIELVTKDGKIMEVHVDAITGEVLEIEEEQETENAGQNEDKN